MQTQLFNSAQAGSPSLPMPDAGPDVATRTAHVKAHASEFVAFVQSLRELGVKVDATMKQGMAGKRGVFFVCAKGDDGEWHGIGTPDRAQWLRGMPCGRKACDCTTRGFHGHN